MANKKNKKTPTIEPQRNQGNTNIRGEELLAWTVSPLRRDPRKAKIFFASTLAFLALVYVAYWDLMWVAFATVLMVGAFNNFIFPSRYRLTTVGVEQGAGLGYSFKPWSAFLKVVKFKDGVQLSHGKGKLRNRLNPGMFVYFGEDNSSEILRIVDKYISQESQTTL
ncbi:MAG: hypothetical protein KGZ53_11350 [Peptococcaceae bacterium]|nr:hypothetical protein [Peptococcaceae bacterium]